VTDPYLVSNVRFTDATPAQIRKGLLGYIGCTVGGRLRLAGLALRRSRAGRLYVSFPRPRDAQGREHVHIWPLNAIARKDIEAQLFRALGIRLEATP
jgi:hypothetical protein